MNAKEYLMQVWLIEQKLARRKEELKVYINRSHGSSEVPVHVAFTREQEHKYWSAQAEMEMLLTEIEKIEIDSIKVRAKVFQTLKQLSKEEYEDVLYKRYFQRLSWNRIAKETNYSKSRLYVIQREALQEIEVLINEV